MTYGRTLQALADPTRREILERLRHGASPVGELASHLPISRPAVSQHLKVLKGAGLVTERRRGTRRVYSIELSGIVEIRRYLDHFWEEVLEAFQSEAESAAGERMSEGEGK